MIKVCCGRSTTLCCEQQMTVSLRGGREQAGEQRGETGKRANATTSVHRRLNHLTPAGAESHARWKKEHALMPGNKAQREAVYTHMWASHEGGPFAPLDESPYPRPHSMLYEVVSACGVNASSLVLDVGSGRGNHSCALAQRFGCAVVGLDVAQFHVEQGQARAVQEGVSDRVSFVQGDIQAPPLRTSVLTSCGLTIC